MVQARYSSWAESPLLHAAQARTTAACCGIGSSRKIFDGTWSRVSVSPPQRAQNARQRGVNSSEGRAASSRGRTRTCDPPVNSRLLYQLSYSGIDQ